MSKNPKTWVDWNDAELLQRVISSSKSRVEVLENLGYNSKSHKSRQKLNNSIKKFSLDISSFTINPDRWNDLPTIIRNCYCLVDVLRAVGLQDKGDNHLTAKRKIREMGLSTTHFDRSKGGSVSSYTNVDMFVENCNIDRGVVKKRILRDNIIPYICSKCENKGEWLGKPITLELEHKNGINNDNRLENLEFLCPNCHSQTPTFRGKRR